LDFEGNGFVVKGEAKPKEGSSWDSKSEKFAQIEVYIDGKLHETAKLPVRFTTRRHEICWKYELGDAPHTVKLKLLNPDPAIICYLSELIWYSSKPQQKMTIGTFGPYKKK
jgi:hypothetical protein